jgi:Flp pilus assembly protein TadD
MVFLPGCGFMRDYRSRVHSEEAFARGAKAMEHHDLAAADQDFAEALRARPDSPSLYARIGLAYMPGIVPYSRIDVAQAERALPCLRRAIELDPKQPFPVYLVAIFASLKLGREDEARTLLSRAGGVFHDDAIALRNIGYSLVDANQLTSDALPCLRRAIELDPKQPYLVYLEAIFAALKVGRDEEARTLLSRAGEVFHDDAMALNNIGYRLVDADKLASDALPLLERAVALRPDEGIIIDSLGWAHYRLRQLPQAAAALERATRLGPEDPEIEYHLGVVYVDMGRTEDARKRFLHALEMDEGFLPARAALHELQRRR